MRSLGVGYRMLSPKSTASAAAVRRLVGSASSSMIVCAKDGEMGRWGDGEMGRHGRRGEQAHTWHVKTLHTHVRVRKQSCFM